MTLLDVTRTDDRHTSERLSAEPVIWLGTVRPGGRPHNVPVWPTRCSSVLGVIGGVWTFTMFLMLAALSFGYVWWLAPETKGRPLESIREYWENGGRWPERTAPSPAADRDGADSRRHAA